VLAHTGIDDVLPASGRRQPLSERQAQQSLYYKAGRSPARYTPAGTPAALVAAKQQRPYGVVFVSDKEMV